MNVPQDTAETPIESWIKKDGGYILTADLEVCGWVVPKGFQSDGCTFPGLAKLLKPFMRADEYLEACFLHDFLRTYSLVTVPEADKLLKRYIRDIKKDPGYAQLYWLAVKLARPWFDEVEALPEKWQEYSYPLSEAQNV